MDDDVTIDDIKELLEIGNNGIEEFIESIYVNISNGLKPPTRLIDPSIVQPVAIFGGGSKKMSKPNRKTMFKNRRNRKFTMKK